MRDYNFLCKDAGIRLMGEGLQERSGEVHV